VSWKDTIWGQDSNEFTDSHSKTLSSTLAVKAGQRMSIFEKCGYHIDMVFLLLNLA
jgi:hypothetical protein